MKEDELENAPFLGRVPHGGDCATNGGQGLRSSWPKEGILRALVFILGVLLIATNCFWWVLYAASNEEDCIRPKLVESPATEVISYHKQRLWRSIEKDNVYAGEPRPEHDEAWRELVKPMAVKISAEELAKLGDNSIALKDGSGYIAEMTVFHELHCIKRIRRHLHLDYYYTNMTEDEQNRETDHMDHCLEYWREAAMCRGDPTLSTFVWHEGKPFSRVYSDHECVNWSSVWNWAVSRMVDTSDPSIFQHS